MSPAHKLLRNPHLKKQDTGRGFLGHPGQAGITTVLSKYVSLCGYSNALARLSEATFHVISTSCKFLHILKITCGSQEAGKLSTQPLVWCNLSVLNPNGIKGNSYRNSENKG